MKDLYDLLPIYSNPVFEHQEILVSDINKQSDAINESEDLFHANFHNLEGQGIFDSILNIGKRIISALPGIAKTTSDVGKTINSSSELYHSIKDFNKPKGKPSPKPKTTGESVKTEN